MKSGRSWCGSLPFELELELEPFDIDWALPQQTAALAADFDDLLVALASFDTDQSTRLSPHLTSQAHSASTPDAASPRLTLNICRQAAHCSSVCGFSRLDIIERWSGDLPGQELSAEQSRAELGLCRRQTKHNNSNNHNNYNTTNEDNER
mmetsp:Transcript_59587/g.126211  ORF Transcript_59587/g.126211 Transcript_59587/m.126211 type:complete len:150 (+) Transcript_59587:187-636(+)